MLKKGDGEINWSNTSMDIWNLIRGMNPWPGSYTTLECKSLKIYKAQAAEGNGKPGEVLESASGVLRVATADGSLEILELQIEGGKRLDTKSFLSGRNIQIGAVLGSK